MTRAPAPTPTPAVTANVPDPTGVLGSGFTPPIGGNGNANDPSNFPDAYDTAWMYNPNNVDGESNRPIVKTIDQSVIDAYNTAFPDDSRFPSGGAGIVFGDVAFGTAVGFAKNGKFYQVLNPGLFGNGSTKIVPPGSPFGAPWFGLFGMYFPATPELANVIMAMSGAYAAAGGYDPSNAMPISPSSFKTSANFLRPPILSRCGFEIRLLMPLRHVQIVLLTTVYGRPCPVAKYHRSRIEPHDMAPSTDPFVGTHVEKDDGVGDVELLEVLRELGDQFLRLGIVILGADPGVARVQQLGVYARNVLGHVQIQGIQVLGFDVVQIAVLDGGNDGAGGRNAETLAFTVGAAGPAGVDQKYLAAELVDTLHQQLGVDAGRAREERCTKAGGEGGLQLGG